MTKREHDQIMLGLRGMAVDGNVSLEAALPFIASFADGAKVKAKNDGVVSVDIPEDTKP